MILPGDIKSSMNSNKVYGKKGDRVQVVKEHGDVAIVEDSKGNRFPINVKAINNQIIQNELF